MPSRHLLTLLSDLSRILTKDFYNLAAGRWTNTLSDHVCSSLVLHMVKDETSSLLQPGPVDSPEPIRSYRTDDIMLMGSLGVIK